MNLRPPSLHLVDLSQLLYHGAPAFPNDPIASIQPRSVFARDTYNTSLVSFGTHQGTHLDAMFHFPLNFRGRDGSPIRAVALCQP